MSLRRGFTLIELLVAITIFSAVMIVAVATFARSATSAVKSNQLRERTEAARALIDQISTDFQYVYLDQSVTIEGGNEINPYTGFGNIDPFTSQAIVLVLRYPETGINNLVWKKYYFIVDTTDNQSTLLVDEKRGCSISSGGELLCTGDSNGLKQNLLSKKYSLEISAVENNQYRAVFDAYDYETATSENRTPYLRIQLSVKGIDYKNISCADEKTPSGLCYKLATTLTLGRGSTL